MQVDGSLRRASIQSLVLAFESFSDSSSASIPALSILASLDSEFFHFAIWHSIPFLLVTPLSHPIPPHLIQFDCFRMTRGTVTEQVAAGEFPCRLLLRMRAESWSWNSFQKWTGWKDSRPTELVASEFALCLAWCPHLATSFSVGDAARNFDFQFHYLYFPFRPSSSLGPECDPMYYQASWSRLLKAS